MAIPPSALGLEHAPALLRLARRLAGDDADDLVQGTYLTALEHTDEVTHRGAWLRQVLINRGRMAARGRERREAREQALVVDDAIDPEAATQARAVAERIAVLLDRLDPSLRLVVYERYFEGRTSAEIAARHGIAAGTVRWRLKAGLDRIRVQLDVEHGDRHVWVGAVLACPTLGPAAAPGDGTGVAAAAVVKATMTTKILWAATLLLTSAACLVAANTGRDDREAVPPAVVTSATATATVPVSPAKQAWERRRAQIRGHLASRMPALPRIGAPPPRCAEPPCREVLAAELDDVTQGCLDGEVPPELDLVARVIGSPEVGVIVESVAFHGGAVSDELRECLIESSYAMDLGATDHDLVQDVTVMLRRPANAAFVPGPDVDDATIRAIERAMAQADASGTVQTVLVHEVPPTPKAD